MRKNKSNNVLSPTGTEEKQSAFKAFLEKFETFKNNFYLDVHHTADRRGVLVIVALSAMLIGGAWTSIGGHYRVIAKNNEITTETTELSFSKSNVGLTLGKAVKSSAGSDIYIPLNFSDLSQMSTNAKNYLVAVKDVNGNVLNHVTGKIVIFGETGHAVLHLKNTGKFGQGPVRVIIRNDKDLTDDSSLDSVNVQKGVEELSKKYDLTSFVINPGANKVKTLEGASDSSSASTLYKVLFGNKDLKKNTKEEKQADEKLASLYNREQEYRTRLEGAGFDVPAIPDKAKRDYRPGPNETNDINTNIPTDIKNKDGKTTSEVSSYDDNSANNDGPTGTTPADNWQALTGIWSAILDAKTNRYVTLTAARDRIHQTIDNQDKVATSTPSHKFRVLR